MVGPGTAECATESVAARAGLDRTLMDCDDIRSIVQVETAEYAAGVLGRAGSRCGARPLDSDLPIGRHEGGSYALFPYSHE